MSSLYEKIINSDSYKFYLKGEIKFYDLSSNLNIEYDKLRYVFSKFKIKTRETFLQETIQHDYFDIIDSESKAYLLGFFYADGSITKNYHISLSLTEEDIEIINLFKKEICPEYKITFIRSYTNKKTGYVSKPMASITFKSKHMCETLFNYGIYNRKTYNDLISLDFIPQDMLIHFIRGYWDGDGCSCITQVTKKHITKDGVLKKYSYLNYNWNIISFTDKHLLILKKFLNKNYNINSNIIKTKKGHFLLEINKKNDYFMMRNVLYENANFYLTRKKEKYMTIPC